MDCKKEKNSQNKSLWVQRHGRVLESKRLKFIKENKRKRQRQIEEKINNIPMSYVSVWDTNQ